LKNIEKLAGWTYFKKEGVSPAHALSRLLVSLCLFPKRERANCRDDECWAPRWRDEAEGRKFSGKEGKMSEEIICPKCGEIMERVERNIAAGPGGGEQGNEYPPEELHIKYKCINLGCSNYGKEFYEDELRE